MLNLPLPLLTGFAALILGMLILRGKFANTISRRFLSLYFLLIASLSFLVALRFGYGFDEYKNIQRSIPFLLGPTLYLAFLALSEDHGKIRLQSYIHYGIALCLILSTLALSELLSLIDALIAASFLVYTIGLMNLLHKGPQALNAVPLGHEKIGWFWLLIATIFSVSMLVFDIVISINFASQQTDQAIWFITIGSAGSLITIGAAILFLSNWTTARKIEKPNVEKEALNANAVEQDARELLIETKLYLEPDLTLNRLARRLHVPARTLSQAINQSQDMNVSHYINQLRLEHAAKLLSETNQSVAVIAEKSGFLSRSNFYREFERVFGHAPAKHREKNK